MVHETAGAKTARTFAAPLTPLKSFRGELITFLLFLSTEKFDRLFALFLGMRGGSRQGWNACLGTGNALSAAC
jgi:hypothetical protein